MAEFVPKMPTARTDRLPIDPAAFASLKGYAIGRIRESG